MNWESDFIDLGIVKKGQRYKVEFKSTKPLNIASMKPGCGSCTTGVKYLNNTLTAIYTPSSVPKHFKKQGKDRYTTTKFITITYRDGTQELLKFKSTVV